MDLFEEVSVRYVADAKLYFVKAFYKNGDDCIEIKGHKTQEAAQKWLDNMMDKFNKG